MRSFLLGCLVTAVAQLIGLARAKPDAVETATFSLEGTPTMTQYLDDEAAVIDRKCGQAGANESAHLRDAAQAKT